MTSQGSPYGRFRRALATGSLSIVRAAAAELPVVALDDAARICALIAEREPARFNTAAVRWLTRMCAEKQATLEHVNGAVGALVLMRDHPAEGLERLLAIWRHLP